MVTHAAESDLWSAELAGDNWIYLATFYMVSEFMLWKSNITKHKTKSVLFLNHVIPDNYLILDTCFFEMTFKVDVANIRI